MLHYHGTPLTPRSALLRMAGKHFCVSFANTRDVDWCIANGQSVMLDNGAFSAFTQGKPADRAGFYSWLESRLGPPHWAVVPDIIDGNADDNLALAREWPHARSLGAVVWHMHESHDHLLRLIDEGFGKICFGSSGLYWQIGSDAWERRCDSAFNGLARRSLRPWIHMLRGLAMSGGRWPFASADSCNVARNFKDANMCPENMARRIDAIQCPVSWELRPEQQEMTI